LSDFKEFTSAIDAIEDKGVVMAIASSDDIETASLNDFEGNGYHTKGRKTKLKTTKLSTEWKGVKRRGQIEAKKSTKSTEKSNSQSQSQPRQSLVNSEKLNQKRNNLWD
ncbi:hypothetical protein Tco_1564698, partial [Tanacetum coccineum]